MKLEGDTPKFSRCFVVLHYISVFRWFKSLRAFDLVSQESRSQTSLDNLHASAQALNAAHPVKVHEQRFDVSTDVRMTDVRLKKGKPRIDPEDDKSVRGELRQHVRVHVRGDEAVETPHEKDRGVVPCLHGEEHCKERTVKWQQERNNTTKSV